MGRSRRACPASTASRRAQTEVRRGVGHNIAGCGQACEAAAPGRLCKQAAVLPAKRGGWLCPLAGLAPKRPFCGCPLASTTSSTLHPPPIHHPPTQTHHPTHVRVVELIAVVIHAICCQTGVVQVGAAPVAEDDGGPDGVGHPTAPLIMCHQPDVVPPAPLVPARAWQGGVSGTDPCAAG